MTSSLAAQDEAIHIDALLTYEFGNRKRQEPIKILIQGEHFRMDWDWPRMHTTMTIIDQDVFILKSSLNKNQNAHFGFISDVDEFKSGEAIGEAMYLMLKLGKLNESQKVDRLQKSMLFKGNQITITRQEDETSAKHYKTLKVFGRKTGKERSFFERLFGNKEYLFLQMDYVDSVDLEDLAKLPKQTIMFQTFHVPQGFAQSGVGLFESYQFHIQKLEKVMISEDTPMLPSLKNIDKVTVSDSRFRDILSKDGIHYTITDGVWPKRDAEIVQQTVERELKFEKYRKQSNGNK